MEKIAFSPSLPSRARLPMAGRLVSVSFHRVDGPLFVRLEPNAPVSWVGLAVVPLVELNLNGNAFREGVARGFPPTVVIVHAPRTLRQLAFPFHPHESFPTGLRHR